jgi:hypothetical protein
VRRAAGGLGRCRAVALSVVSFRKRGVCMRVSHASLVVDAPSHREAARDAPALVAAHRWVEALPKYIAMFKSAFLLFGPTSLEVRLCSSVSRFPIPCTRSAESRRVCSPSPQVARACAGVASVRIKSGLPDEGTLPAARMAAQIMDSLAPNSLEAAHAHFSLAIVLLSFEKVCRVPCVCACRVVW